MDTFETNAALHWAHLETSTKCFEPESAPIEPTQICDIPLGSGLQPHSNPVLRRYEFRDKKSLSEYLKNPATGGSYSSRMISISQKNSWSRLQITKPMLQELVEHHDIDAGFLEVPLSFAHRTTDEEQGFCIPWTLSRKGNSTRIFYTFRYAQHKGHPNEPWVIRQMGVYHSFDMQSKQCLLILLNAVPDSVAYGRALKSFSSYQAQLLSHPLWIHSVLHASYFLNWREYLAEYEKRLLPIADTTTAAFISRPLRISHDTLGKVRSLESRFLPVPAILTHFEEVIECMGSLGDELVASGCVVQPEQKRVATSSSNVKRYCRSFTRTSLFLQQRSSNTAVLLADTLAFRNQGVAQQQNESVVLLTKAAVFITVITLVYLPWTLVTGVFGMEFFEMDPQTHGLKVSPQIWIYFATAVCASILTVTLYYVISWFWRDRINPNRPGRDQVGSFVPLCLQRGYTDIEKVAQMTEVQPART